MPRVSAAPAAAIGLALALALAAAPEAPASTAWAVNADGRLVDVEVLVDGQAAPLYWKSGTWDRRYFQAFRGRNYSLAVTNNTGRRVGVLIAVDGLNVVNGERSRLTGTEPMYVLGPNERAVIRGWRTSLSNVRRFVFVDEERSYAERTGQASGDMGWIRVLSFREQQPNVWIEPRDRGGNDEWRPFGARESQRDEAGAPRAQELESGRGDADRQNAGERAGGENGNGKESPRESRSGEKGEGKAQAEAPSTGGIAKRSADSFHTQPSPEANPGTGWGERSWDPVQRTVFLAAHSATDQIVLRYEYASGLAALGIHPRQARTWYRERGEMSFAQAPRR